MKKSELKEALIDAIGLESVRSRSSRVLHVTIARSAYGCPSTIVFEFAGSPAQFPVVITKLQGYRADCPTIHINDRKEPYGTPRWIRVQQVVQRYLDDAPRCGHIDFATKDCVEHDAIDLIADGVL